MPTIGHGTTATSVYAVLPDLPEPIPERVVYGYLNDELACECLRAGLFFTPTCRWCGALMSRVLNSYYLCGGTSEFDSCDALLNS